MDVNKILESVLGSQRPATGGTSGGGGSGFPSGLLGGAAAGGLMGMLTGSKKKKRGLGNKVLTYGGLAVVGGLAYKAYRDWQAKNAATAAQQPQASPPVPISSSGFDVENDRDAAGDDFRLVLVRAMIAAAQSDGHIDRDEHRRIRDQVGEWDLGPAEKGALYDYFSDPADAATIAGLARSDEQRAEIYLASALCIDPDTPEEERYLATLADRLRLPDGLRGYLDAEAEAARADAAA